MSSNTAAKSSSQASTAKQAAQARIGWSAAFASYYGYSRIVGPIVNQDDRRIVRFNGELPLAATVPFMGFADLGLFFIPLSAPAIETFGLSLKLTQHAYCRLPILGPSAVATTLQRYAGYGKAGRSSIERALNCPPNTGHGCAGARAWPSWDEVTDELVNPQDLGETRDGPVRRVPPGTA